MFWLFKYLIVFFYPDRDLQSEGDNLATRLFHMNNLKTDVRSDISVMKRAAERADLDVTHLEVFKKRQVSIQYNSL